MRIDRRCPTCGQIMDPGPAVSVEKLRMWCAERGFPVFPMDRVGEQAAAAILGKCEKTLRNLRYCGSGIPFCRSGGGRGRVSYFLRDLSEILKAEDFCP